MNISPSSECQESMWHSWFWNMSRVKLAERWNYFSAVNISIPWFPLRNDYSSKNSTLRKESRDISLLKYDFKGYVIYSKSEIYVKKSDLINFLSGGSINEYSRLPDGSAWLSWFRKGKKNRWRCAPTWRLILPWGSPQLLFSLSIKTSLYTHSFQKINTFFSY